MDHRVDTKKIKSEIFNVYLDIVLENMSKGNFVDIDFVTYSKLVECLVNEFIDKSNKLELEPIFFTALCLPPFKWYNWASEGAKVSEPSQVEKMRTDPLWVDYLYFVNDLNRRKVNIYRKFFCHNYDNPKERGYFKNLIDEDTLNSQINSAIVVKINSIISPLNEDEIKSILGDLYDEKYKCYQGSNKAYLLIDKDDINFIRFDRKIFKVDYIRDHISIFQKGPLSPWIYTKNHGFDKDLPQDFFLAGCGKLNSPNLDFFLRSSSRCS